MIHLTINGELTIRRRAYWAASVGMFCPADQLLGIQHNAVSVGVRERCCQEALDSSFANVVRSLRTLGQLRLSEDRVRRIVEAEGKTVTKVRNTSQLGASFTIDDCKDGVMVTGVDGVFVPVVSETQKAKRRQTEAQKRASQGRSSTRRCGRPKKGADGAYKEAKIVVFYDQSKTGIHVAGTLGNAYDLGRIMRREAGKVKLDQASFSYSVADGAKWIQNQYRLNLPMIDEHLLDWYHFKEHVVETGYAIYGEQTFQAGQWQQKMLDAAWNQGSLVMLHKLGAYERRHKGENREMLLKLRNYVEPRITMTDYPSFKARGYDCGSGPTESQCGTLTARVDGAGMRWDVDNAASMLALTALDHSNLWTTYWKFQRAA